MREVGTGHVKLDIDGYRADIVLNRPEKRNAMNQDVLGDLRTAFETVDDEEDVRAIALLGEGPVFSAGMDLEMMAGRAEEGGELEVGLHDVTEAIADARVPVVAGLKRAAPAGAFELSLPADFRIISDEATYGVIEVKLGLFPSGGAPTRLARLVGLGKAKELVLSGEYIDPEEAKQIGLVNEVCEAEAVDDRARAWADKLTENAPLGMQRARKVLNATLQMPLEESLEYEQALAEPLTDTDDYTEGFTARIEDREPEFEGR
ncbi:MAG: enoyl-CoA hydratase/isomerase family protein [Haloarculaceae archaeon]